MTVWAALASFYVDTADFIGHKCACNGGTCNELARWSVPWPGRERVNQCEGHKSYMQQVARAMGFELEGITPLDVMVRNAEPEDPTVARFAAMELD